MATVNKRVCTRRHRQRQYSNVLKMFSVQRHATSDGMKTVHTQFIKHVQA